MSATHNWSRPVGSIPRARFGTTRQPWRESVVTGTKARFFRHSRLSSRIRRSTLLWFHGQAFATQLRRDPAIAVVRMGQRQALDGVAHPGLFLARRRGGPMAVVPGPAHARERAHPFDREFALRQGTSHRLDDFVDPVTPGPALGRRAPLTCRKACRKKSSSTCCWPILRSSAATRLCAFSSSPAAPGELDPPPARKADRSELRGRPGPRRASGPPQRKRSRQMYKSLLENCSSRANARTFSPASIRLTIPSLNARLKTRCDDLGLDIRSPMENCPLFSVSHFWGALHREFEVGDRSDQDCVVSHLVQSPTYFPCDTQELARLRAPESILRIQAAILVSTGLASDRRFIASSGRVKRHVETVPAIDGDNRQCELRRFNLVEFLCRPCCRPRLEPVGSEGE